MALNSLCQYLLNNHLNAYNYIPKKLFHFVITYLIDYVVLVGGAPLNEEFGKAIGADAYCRDAAVAVETAKEFMAKKHNQLSM